MIRLNLQIASKINMLQRHHLGSERGYLQIPAWQIAPELCSQPQLIGPPMYPASFFETLSPFSEPQSPERITKWEKVTLLTKLNR